MSKTPMSKDFIPVELLARSILVLRGQKVLLDVDLACLYGVATSHVNRNISRFPADFMFQLTADEAQDLKCQIGISSWGDCRQRSYDLEKRVGKHDKEIGAIINAIRQLMAPPAKTKREIGFHVRETAPRYRTRKTR